jgi:hypothetical protein
MIVVGVPIAENLFEEPELAEQVKMDAAMSS